MAHHPARAAGVAAPADPAAQEIGGRGLVMAKRPPEGLISDVANLILLDNAVGPVRRDPALLRAVVHHVQHLSRRVLGHDVLLQPCEHLVQSEASIWIWVQHAQNQRVHRLRRKDVRIVLRRISHSLRTQHVVGEGRSGTVGQVVQDRPQRPHVVCRLSHVRIVENHFRSYVSRRSALLAFAEMASKTQINDHCMHLGATAIVVEHDVVRLQVHMHQLFAVHGLHPFHNLIKKGRHKQIAADVCWPTLLGARGCAAAIKALLVQEFAQAAAVEVRHHDPQPILVVDEIGRANRRDAITGNLRHLPQCLDFLDVLFMLVSDPLHRHIGLLLPACRTSADHPALEHNPEAALAHLRAAQPVSPLRRQWGVSGGLVLDFCKRQRQVRPLHQHPQPRGIEAAQGPQLLHVALAQSLAEALERTHGQGRRQQRKQRQRHGD
mmetsp:Transcript_18684/g.44300  ORF Transcript_18684/g.44300 Transcript_18684/m.44300 type:complete len:436 (-) Transcript_18684:50-1357(-)